MAMSTETKIAWRLWALSLVLIMAVLVVLSFLLDINAIGATGRFAWNAMVAALLASARGLDTILAYILRRRIWRTAAFFTSVGLGYSGNVVLTRARLERAKGWRGTLRRYRGCVRSRWNALATPWKLVCIAVVIVLQIWLFPVLSEYVLLIPIGFMIPLVARGTRRMYAWLADSIFAASYRRYLGPTHRAAARKLWALAPLHAARGGIRLMRMRYLAAWRLWKYDPRYRDPSGELWVSPFEPIRLWRARKLDCYIGRPLFGRRAMSHCRVGEIASRVRNTSDDVAGDFAHADQTPPSTQP
jgi:hypothetical protein